MFQIHEIDDQSTCKPKKEKPTETSLSLKKKVFHKG